MFSILGGCFGAYFTSSPSPYVYGVVVDAGSVHTSVYTYRSAFLYHVQYICPCTLTGKLSFIVESTYIHVHLKVSFPSTYTVHISVYTFRLAFLLHVHCTVHISVYTFRLTFLYNVQYLHPCTLTGQLYFIMYSTFIRVY